MNIINAKEAYKKSEENSIVYQQERVNDFLVTCELAIEVATKKGETEATIDSNKALGLDWSEPTLYIVGRELGELGYDVTAQLNKKLNENKLFIDWSNAR